MHFKPYIHDFCLISQVYWGVERVVGSGGRITCDRILSVETSAKKRRTPSLSCMRCWEIGVLHWLIYWFSYSCTRVSRASSGLFKFGSITLMRLRFFDFIVRPDFSNEIQVADNEMSSSIANFVISYKLYQDSSFILSSLILAWKLKELRKNILEGLETNF